MNLDSPLAENRIRILRIIARMNIGGPAVQVTGLMKNFDKKIFNQILATGYVSNDEADYLLENSVDIPVIRVDGLGRSIKPWSDLTAFFKLIKIAREFKPHIIHTHTAKAGVLGRLLWLFLGYKPKMVHTFHGHLLNGYFGKFKTKIVVLVERFLGLFTDKFFAVGRQVANDLINAGIGKSDKFLIVPPGLSINTVPHKRDVASRMQLNPEFFYCTFLGRVTDIKQPFRFLEIAKHAKSGNFPINFLLVGSGNLLEECKEIVSTQNLPVSCLGWINSVEDILAMTDVMVLTSLNEGMPLSLIQAGMAGIPSIATNVGSTSEVVQDDVTGYLLPYDPKLFIEKIAFLKNNKSEYQRLSETAQKHTIEKFGISRLVNDHEQAYLSLLNYK